MMIVISRNRCTLADLILIFVTAHSYVRSVMSWGLVQSVQTGPGPIAAVRPANPRTRQNLIDGKQLFSASRSFANVESKGFT